jgi:hypothetical protein
MLDQIMTSDTSTSTAGREDSLYCDIKAALATIARNDADTFDQWVVIGDRLAKLRAEHPGFRGSGFAEAVQAHGIDLTRRQIAAAQWWARLSESERTELRREIKKASLETFYTHKSTVHKVNSKSPARKPSEKTEAARKAIREMGMAGKPINRDELAQELNVSAGTVQRAELQERARLETLREAEIHAPIDPSILSAPLQKKFEILQKRLAEQYDYQLHLAVVKHINEVVLPSYKEKLEQADKVLNGAYKPVFTNSQYRMIWAALHPDSHAEQRSTAFNLFQQHEIRLRGTDKPLAYGLPSSVEELLKMRKTKAGR